MNSSSDQIWLPIADLRRLCLHWLKQLGVPDSEASLTTDTLLDADLRGVDSHGIALLPIFAERIGSGQIRPGRLSFVRREEASTALLDGQHGMGPPLATAAMSLAAEKAVSAGLGVVSLRDCNYVGALATYVEAPARAGLLAIAMANATPRVAPHGGRSGMHGTNPIAWAAPTLDGDPVLFDGATAHAASRLGQAAEDGEPLADGIALDAAGEPTTDPLAAAKGVLLPLGGSFGYGLGLLVDILTGGLAASPMGPEVPLVTALDGAYGCSFFGLVLDPDRFCGRAALASGVTRLSESAREIRPAEAGQTVRVPGDRARATYRQRQQQGIPMSRNRWSGLLARLAATGLDISSAHSLTPD